MIFLLLYSLHTFISDTGTYNSYKQFLYEKTEHSCCKEYSVVLHVLYYSELVVPLRLYARIIPLFVFKNKVFYQICRFLGLN